jgi:lipopolysaccharide assembly outer membrane protein LptD (OstA)
LSDQLVPNPGTGAPTGNLTELEDSSSRTVPVLAYGMSSGIERVYDLERGNWFADLVGLGAQNEGLELARLKHTIEPNVQFTYVPFEEQDDLPYFDANDRLRQRSVVTYGITQRLYGRMLRPYERSREIGELAPSEETLPMFDLGSSLLEFGRGMVLNSGQAFSPRKGEIRELVTFNVRQSFDYIEDTKDRDPTLPGLSDVTTGLAITPSQYLAFSLGGNVNTEDKDISSYDLGVGFRDDRGDALRLRYVFVNENGQLSGNAPGRGASMIEGNLELKLTNQLRAGWYARYDEEESIMQESTALLRFINSCRCWSVDFGYGRRGNPDREQVLLTFTFMGLGDITQNIGLPQQLQDQQQ